jgi:hypothetical protein
MRSPFHAWYQSLLVALLATPVPVLGASGEDPRFGRTVERVLSLLPKRPPAVAVIDPRHAKPDVRPTLLEIDAFITKGGRIVYLTSHSEVMRGALKHSSLHEHMLAAIVWHEMAHLEGATEEEAQRREEQLWTQYVMDERVDRIHGLRYLAALKGRRGGPAGPRERGARARVGLPSPSGSDPCTRPRLSRIG